MGTALRRPWLRHLMMTGAASLALLAGCSDDGEDEADEGDATTTPDTELIGVDSCDEIPESSGGALNQGAVVNMIEFEFCQADVQVEAGQTVRFINNGSTRHQVVHTPPGEQERLFGPDEAMLSGDSYDFTFTDPGTYPYVCTFHREQMVGSVTVN
jgi:plastocyanin